MSVLKAIRRLEYINYLIRMKATGDLESLANRCGLSKRAMTDFLNMMRDLGADIRFDRTRHTYYYAEDGEITVTRFLKYGQKMPREDVATSLEPDKLCFSEKAVFIRCREVD